MCLLVKVGNYCIGNYCKCLLAKVGNYCSRIPVSVKKTFKYVL